MKLLFTALLCLLLTACAPSAEVPPHETVPAAKTSDSLQTLYGSTVEAVSLPFARIDQLLSLEEDLLVRSGRELVLLDPDFREKARLTLDADAEVAASGRSLSAFDSLSRQLTVLSPSLEPVRQLTLPADLSGSPVLSSDGSTLYYCTGSGIYRWELDSGIRRRIREAAQDHQTLEGLHWEDSVLQWRVGADPRDLFVDAQTGQLLHSLEAPARLLTRDGTYYCSFSAGFVKNHLFGTQPDAPQCLLPENPGAQCIFLPFNHLALTVEAVSKTETTLTCYDLNTGCIRDTLTLRQTLHAVADSTGGIWLLLRQDDQDLLLKWHPAAGSGGTGCVSPYYSAQSPDSDGLAACREQARMISESFGIPVLIGPEAAAEAPWDYTFTPEHRCPVIRQQLQTLEACLAQYPEAVLKQTAADFDSLTICLVQSITGTSHGQSLSTATGIQFLNGGDARVVLSAGQYQQQALYHELYHVMETHILSHSGALDRWNELNPAGFSYDLDLQTNAGRNSGVYLENGTRAFVDTYSMSFPREDRARVFEYAMLPDQAHLFQSEIMQRKLHALCTAIREAYGLDRSEEALPWEQYLKR